MEKKYELTNYTLEFSGYILHRIKALKSFGNVKEGELGGFVGSEKNLSHSGNCWIWDNATVYEDAKVVGDAQILDSALVFGTACIFGNSQIMNHAQVHNSDIDDYAKVYDASLIENSSIYGNAEIHGMTVVDSSSIGGDSEICKRVYVRNAEIFGDAIIKSDDDYIVFKNSFSSGRNFTWTRSNDKWKAGCFYGSGKELIEKAYQDNPMKGKYYEVYVNLVNELNKIDQYANEIYKILPGDKAAKYENCEGFKDNCFFKGNDYYYLNKEWKRKCDEKV